MWSSCLVTVTIQSYHNIIDDVPCGCGHFDVTTRIQDYHYEAFKTSHPLSVSFSLPGSVCIRQCYPIPEPHSLPEAGWSFGRTEGYGEGESWNKASQGGDTKRWVEGVVSYSYYLVIKDGVFYKVVYRIQWMDQKHSNTFFIIKELHQLSHITKYYF